MSWTSNTGMVDSLIRDYLSQRGFNATVKSFDLDLKQDKEKGFRAEKILQHILNFVYSFDLDSLRSYWNHLESKIFCRFDQTQMLTVKKLEYNLYRLYIVNCMQNGKKRECLEFFEKFGQVLGGLSEWKDWFALPFLSHPENNKLYAAYFSKQWSDTFLVSFQNFLAVTFSCMPTPQLYEAMTQDKIKVEQLEKEIEALKKKSIESNSITTKPSQKTPPNYVKSMGVPGGLVENNPTVVVQPQKKKTLPFSFPTKKNPTSTSKSKVPPVKQSSQGSPKPIKKQTEAVPAEPTAIPPTASQETVGMRNKKLSGYQMQRRELLGGVVNVPKTKAVSTKEDELSSSPVNQSHPPTTPAPLSASPKTTTPVHQNNTTVAPPVKPDVSPEIGNPALLKQAATPPVATNSHLLLSKDEYQEHHSAIVQCRFNITGGSVASCDKDGVVKVWQYEPKLTTVATVMSKSPFLSLEWCKTSDTLLLLGTSSGVLRLYETSTKQTQQDIITSNNYPKITQIACNATSSAFATSCVSRSLESAWSSAPDSAPLPGRLELWTLSSGRAEIDRILHESPDSDIKCISFNHDGNLLVSGDANGILTMFDTRSCQPVTSKSAHGKSIYTLQFGNNDNFVFTLGADGKFLGWDSRNLTEPITFPIHPLAAGPFEVSGYSGYRQVHKPSGGKLFSFEPEGRHILTCDGNSALIYKIDTSLGALKKEMTLVGHRTPVLSVDWVSSINCGHCLTGSMDGRVHVTTLLNQ